jgi:uncharacterized pyridoxamine 5'-phosphate oxidase family protein
VSKNELFRQLLHQAYQSAVPFRYVLGDSWYTNAENMKAVLAIGKHYVRSVKSNPEVALSATDKANGEFIKISEINLAVGTLRKVYMGSVKQGVVICRDIYINKDRSQGELLLLSTDVNQTFQQIITSCQKRWEVEDYPKSLKNNISLEASPAHSMQT